MRIKKLLPLALAMVVSCYTLKSFAVAPGLYMGIMGGPASNPGNPTQANVEGLSGVRTTVKPRTNQFAGRFFLGYKFVPYAALESGFTIFSTINYNSGGVPTCGKTKIYLGTFDIVGKLSAPLGPVEIYGKGGVAINYMVQTAAIGDPQLCAKSFHQYTFGPALGIGANYALTQNVVVDLSFNRFNVGSPVKYMTFYALGFSYHFVDKYCGQFLCDE